MLSSLNAVARIQSDTILTVTIKPACPAPVEAEGSRWTGAALLRSPPDQVRGRSSDRRSGVGVSQFVPRDRDRPYLVGPLLVRERTSL